MSSILKILVGMSICLTIGACSSKSDSKKAVEETNDSLAQTKKDMDKTAEDAKKAGEQAQESAQKAIDSMMDSTAAGGQPGSISLSGNLVTGDDGALDSHLSVKMVSGKSWKGVRPEVKQGTLALTPKLPEAALETLEKLKEDKSFINFGCDIASREELKDLEEKQLDSKDSTPVMVLTANTIVICGANPFTKTMTNITAKKVIFSNFQQEMIGALSQMLSITAQDLKIEGENHMSSVGKDGTSTLLQGPSISLAAENVSGEGKLKITSQGSSYEAAAK